VRALAIFLLLAAGVAAAACSGDGRGGAPAGSASVALHVPSAVGPALAPLPDVTAAPLALGTAVGRPVSFAPLVERADASVAFVRAIIKSGGQKAGEGLGTAFVYDPKGLLLTNHHVVERADEITVGFAGGVDMPATIVGSDKETDVAVLRIAQEGLPALPLGDSDQIAIGDWVVAIGNPFGLAHTVSAGILSAKGRTRDDVMGLDPNGYFHFLQTDASINPGSSGGPLIDLEGKVVGINAAVRQNANGIGFAIPINMVKQLLPLLLTEGKVRRSAIGVIVDDLDVDEANRLGRKDRKGAWVKGVRDGGPADKAGLAVDDVIIGFEGVPIADPNALRWHASIFGVGKSARVRVARGAREFDVQVLLGPLDQPK
jgi:serine protease Do